MSKAKVYKKKESIRTYLIGEPDPNPFISEYLGSLNFYPYPLKNKISDESQDVEYELYYLENDFFKISFLPDLGGKLYSAVDKRTGDDIFYKNPVIKPQLVGCTGAWTSGGIEFNFPNRGHRPTATDYTDTIIKEYDDGSVSVIISDIDMISWQRFSVEIKLYPDKAYIEQIVRMYNPNDYTDSYYFWTTSAELEKEGLEFRYPFLWHTEEESRKKYVWPFPEDSPFAAEGVDLRYCDTMQPFTLPFGSEVLKDYFGLYDPAEDGGVVHVADFREVPGKKVWAWGKASAGIRWCKRLTDNDDRYVELQTGAVETQNEFNLIEPHNQIEYREYWLYSKDNGPLCAASKNVIASFKIEESKIIFSLIGTDCFSGVDFNILVGGQEVFSQKINLNTQKSTKIEVPFDSKWLDEEIEFSVNREKQSLIRETILDNKDALEMIDNEEYISTDEPRESRFAKALFFEKRRFYNKALALYNQIVEDNPEYVQAYIRKANCYLKKHNYERALQVLENILQENYEDRELLYYYALALWYSGQKLKAKKYFYKIPNSSKYFAAASYFIALDYVVEGKYEKVFSKLDYSNTHQSFHYKSFLLYAYTLLKSGKKEEAEDFLLDYLEAHPMDYIAMYLLEETNGEKKYNDFILNKKQNAYHILGFLDEVQDWDKCLNLIKDYARQKDTCSLLTAYQYYYLELIEGKNKQNLVNAIENISLDYIFPNHSLDLKVLDLVKDESEKARYLYGLLQYRAENYSQVKEIWEELVSKGFSYSVLYRNLAYYYQKHEENYARSSEIAEAGFNKKPFNDDFFYLLYQAYNHLGMKEKLKSLLQSIEKFESKSEPCIRVWIDMLNQLNRYEEAAEVLEKTNFNIYEHDPENLVPYPKIYKETYLGLAREALKIKEYDEAWNAIERCLDMEKRYEEKFAEIYFYAGLIKEKIGDFEEALAYYQKIISENIQRDDKENYQYHVKAAHRIVKFNWIGIK